MSSQAPELHLLVRLRVKHGVDGKEARALMSNNLAELPLLVPLPVKCRVGGKEGRVPIGNPAVLRAANLLLELRLESQRAERKRARKLLRVLALNKTKLASEKRRSQSDPGSPPLSVQALVCCSGGRGGCISIGFCRRHACLYSNSAICTAFNAAPFSNWSPDTQNESPFSKAQSTRTRPTSQLSFPATLSGMG